MKKFLKWTGITLLSLVLLVLLASWIFASKFNSEFEKVYDLTPTVWAGWKGKITFYLETLCTCS